MAQLTSLTTIELLLIINLFLAVKGSENTFRDVALVQSEDKMKTQIFVPTLHGISKALLIPPSLSM